jgi:hypothetical protein
MNDTMKTTDDEAGFTSALVSDVGDLGRDANLQLMENDVFEMRRGAAQKQAKIVVQVRRRPPATSAT